MLHIYTEPPPPPPRANAASRFPNSNFPPPPKPPLFTAKTTKGSTPTTGSQKLARFHMPDARSSAYNRKEFDNAKTKTSDFKAWEHMRHGSGPLPRSRKDNTQSAKATSGTAEGGRAFNADRDAKDLNPRRPTSRQTDWEDKSDAGMSNPQRTSTMRPVPKVNGYAPTTSNAGDEPQARSAYFNVSRADRPTSSGNRSNMPPPPSRAPTAKKADPLQAFKERWGMLGHLGVSNVIPLTLLFMARRRTSRFLSYIDPQPQTRLEKAIHAPASTIASLWAPKITMPALHLQPLRALLGLHGRRDLTLCQRRPLTSVRTMMMTKRPRQHIYVPSRLPNQAVLGCELVLSSARTSIRTWG